MHLLLILRREHVREVGLPVTLEELGAGKVTSQILDSLRSKSGRP